MTHNALSLSDQQLKLVQQGARFVPVEVRDFYLRSVSDALGNKQQPSDAEVFRAVRDVLTAVRVPIYHLGAHNVGDGD